MDNLFVKVLELVEQNHIGNDNHISKKNGKNKKEERKFSSSQISKSSPPHN